MSTRANLLYSFGYQLFAILVPLVSAPYVTRVLGPDSAGAYAYTYSIAYYFALFAMLGVAAHGSRSVASISDRSSLGSEFVNIYAVQLCASVVAIGLYLVYALSIATEHRALVLVQLLVIVAAALDITWLFYGLERFRLVVLRNAICKIATLFCIFAFVRSSTDLTLYAAIMAGGVLLSQAIMWRWACCELTLQRPRWHAILGNVKPMLVLFLPIAAYSLYRVMDKVMLGVMSSMSEVAYFEYAEKILNVPIGFITALGLVMLPRSSNLLAEGNESERSRYMAISTQVVSVGGGGMCCILSAVAPTLVPLYYGDAFTPSAAVLELLVFSVVFAGWASVIRTQCLIPERRDNVYVTSMLAGAVVNVALNIILIPSHGAMGAVVSTLVAEFVILAVQAVWVRSRLRSMAAARENIPYVVAALPVWFTVRILADLGSGGWGSVFLQIAVGCLLYGILVLVIARRQSDQVWAIVEREMRRCLGYMSRL